MENTNEQAKPREPRPKGLPPEVPPPEHLSQRSKHLWRGLLSCDKSIERQELLQAALEALDRADEARRIVQAEGLTSKTATTGVVHVHPALKVEREARTQFVKIWGLLHPQSKSPWDL